MKKRKRLNQLAAQEEKAKRQNDTQAAQNTGMGGGVLGISDCDLGASPQMTKTSILNQYKKVKMSPLGGVSSRQFQQISKMPNDNNNDQ